MGSFQADGHVIRAIDEWLDREIDRDYKEQPMAQDLARITKIAEELGEASSAFIGVTGQNPRKGFYSSTAEVNNELADVAWTAILAIQHFTKNDDETTEILAERLYRIYKRTVKS